VELLAIEKLDLLRFLSKQMLPLLLRGIAPAMGVMSEENGEASPIYCKKVGLVGEVMNARSSGVLLGDGFKLIDIESEPDDHL